ncbi:winged helix-turn-helix domain-containing protein [Jannaschia sp. CCS1]|uniref:winged helix-turn-helix domain-containing protein n=1 Tax=Jannaschia sp. (strain CCS1) TaxID=290400 RepID=UPI000053C08B|nr:winged helix-turn-helix domain-containing protein [Jannaschia sp. CCS1]ABD56586.1 transcriptional regulatory protein-like protein [Jannaschia sp. CCS1]
MIYAFEDFTIDTDRFQLARGDELIETEPQTLEFLIFLAQNQGQMLTKDTLHEVFWPDRVVSDAALSTLVRNARRAIGDSGEQQRVIATRHGRGFVFRADVREFSDPQPAAMPRSVAAAAPSPRIAGAPALMVLPFEIVGETQDAAGLSEGVTEEVMAALSKSRWFPLIARNRVRTFQELSPETRHPFVGFGASYIVEGGVFRDGDDIRVHLQLTDTEPALHIHLSRHDFKYEGLFKLFDEIATVVAATAQPELIKAEHQKAEKTDPEARSAWQEFVLGQYLLAAPDKPANAAARAHFERAMSLEPGSGRIHAGLAMTHLWDYWYDWSQNAGISLETAARDAERALTLAPDDSWAWSILAICKLSLRRYDVALADAQRAIDADPASAMAHGCHAWVLAYAGRYRDALAAYDRAVALGGPSDPRRVLWMTGRETAQFGLGDYEGALDTARELIALSPDNPSGYRVKCAALASLGRLVEARRAAAKLVALLPGHDVDTAIARQPFQPELASEYAAALKKAGLKGGAVAIE